MRAPIIGPLLLLCLSLAACGGNVTTASTPNPYAGMLDFSGEYQTYDIPPPNSTPGLPKGCPGLINLVDLNGTETWTLAQHGNRIEGRIKQNHGFRKWDIEGNVLQGRLQLTAREIDRPVDSTLNYVLSYDAARAVLQGVQNGKPFWVYWAAPCEIYKPAKGGFEPLSSDGEGSRNFLLKHLTDPSDPFYSQFKASHRGPQL